MRWATEAKCRTPIACSWFPEWPTAAEAKGPTSSTCSVHLNSGWKRGRRRTQSPPPATETAKWIERALPLRRLQLPEMLRVLVDDRDTAAGLDDPADLADRHVDLDCVLERLGRICCVEPAILERQRRHRSGAGAHTFRDMLQHLR